jgi:heterodisulfide reductase subunit C
MSEIYQHSLLYQGQPFHKIYLIFEKGGFMEIQRKVKFEEELDHNFMNEVQELSFSEEISRCIQCGTCSSSCPLATYMDYTPRKIIAMVKDGFKDEVLKSFTPWLCASCYSCQVRCPSNIKIADIMYTLKREAIKANVYPAKFPIPALAQEMHKIIAKNGRNSELWLVLNMYLRLKNPFGPLKMASTGLNLIKTGRMSLKKEKIKNRKQLHSLLKAVMERAK